VLFYYWLQVERLPRMRAALERVRGRLLIGICSEYELEDAWRAPGLATLEAMARAVFVNNERLLRIFAPQLGPPVFYTPNGVDTRFFRPAAAARPPGPLRVGWAGSLGNQTAEQRGVHEFIAPAVAAVPGMELRLAVREEKWRGLEEMLDFYHGLDVYVCASKSEGTPNPCLEAAACGLPIVTTRVGNMPARLQRGPGVEHIGVPEVELRQRQRRQAAPGHPQGPRGDVRIPAEPPPRREAGTGQRHELEEPGHCAGHGEREAGRGLGRPQRRHLGRAEAAVEEPAGGESGGQDPAVDVGLAEQREHRPEGERRPAAAGRGAGQPEQQDAEDVVAADDRVLVEREVAQREERALTAAERRPAREREGRGAGQDQV
jgi:hypothetical protein